MFDAAPCSTEPTVSPQAEAMARLDKIEHFIGNFRFLSAEARAHLANEFDELRGYLSTH
jgi:hypothetical protein